jgi:protein-S-isoprenylcysteine O-methyltransferase Ste14
MVPLTENKKHTNRQLIAPVLASICLTAMFLMNLFFPLFPIVPLPFRLVGFLLSGAGFALCFTAKRQFEKAGTNFYPFNDPQKLVTGGLFRYTRNPMYLGLVVFLAGVWMVLGSLSPLAMVMVFLLAADRWYIPYEEHRLTAVFGKAYQAYQAKTPRWM